MKQKKSPGDPRGTASDLCAVIVPHMGLSRHFYD